MLTPHEFEGVAEGVADRPCTRPGCGLADRHPVHAAPGRRQVGWVTPGGSLMSPLNPSAPDAWKNAPDGWTPVYVDPGAAQARTPFCVEHDTALVFGAPHRIDAPPAWYCPCDPGHSLGLLRPGLLLDLVERMERLAAGATQGEDPELYDDQGWYVDADRGCLEPDELAEPLVRACDGEVVGSFPRREDAELAALQAS